MAPTIIPLESEKGQQMMREVLENDWPDQPWLRLIFTKQVGGPYCGIQSGCLVMSAAELSEKFPECPTSKEGIDPPYKEGNMFESEAMLKVADSEYVHIYGLSLEEVGTVIRNHGFKSRKVYTSASNVDEFRQDAINALSHKDSKQSIIVNYLKSYFGWNKLYGHHSPLAAYHKESDCFLLMDVWPERPVCWAKAEDIFNAMDTYDEDSNSIRGYLIVTHADR